MNIIFSNVSQAVRNINWLHPSVIQTRNVIEMVFIVFVTVDVILPQILKLNNWF